MKKITVSDMEFDLKYPVKKRIEDNNCIVILLEIPPGVIYNENVFVFDLLTRKLLWQVQKSIVDKHKLGDDEPFVDVAFNSDKNLILWNWGGWRVTVNPSTGEELLYEFTK